MVQAGIFRYPTFFLSAVLATLFAMTAAPAQEASQPIDRTVQEEHQQVLQAAERFFQSIRDRDPDTAASLLIDTGSLFFQRRNADGSYTLHHLSNAEWLSRMRNWTVEVREDTSASRAQVWGPIATISQTFVFQVSGRIRHCGTNLIQLVRDGQNWRIANIIWTEEQSGCVVRTG